MDNLQIIPFGSIQARLFPTSIPEPGAAELTLFYHVEQNTTVDLTLADGTPQNVRIDNARRSTRLVLNPAESRITIALTVAGNDLPEPEQPGTLTITLSPDNQEAMLSNMALTFTIPANDTPTLSLTPSHAKIKEGETVTLTVTVDPVPIDLIEAELVLQGESSLSTNDLTLPTIMLKEGQSSARTVIEVNQDDESEPLETATLKLKVAQGLARVDERRGSFVLMVVDDDAIRLRIKVYLEGAL